MNEDKSEISDGCHTFGELYEHRHALFLALMKQVPHCSPWVSRKHHDGSGFEGWFIAGLTTPIGMITYHLPDSLWTAALAAGAEVLQLGKPWDGHTPADTVNRLRGWAQLPEGGALDYYRKKDDAQRQRIEELVDCVGTVEQERDELKSRLAETACEIALLKARTEERKEAVRGLMEQRGCLVKQITGLNMVYREFDKALATYREEIATIDARVGELLLKEGE